MDAPGRRGLPPVRVALDEAPAKLDAGRLRGLRPAFRPGGSVTAGNSSPVTDGAAALVLASLGAAARLGLPVRRGAWPAAPRQELCLKSPRHARRRSAQAPAPAGRRWLECGRCRRRALARCPRATEPLQSI